MKGEPGQDDWKRSSRFLQVCLADPRTTAKPYRLAIARSGQLSP